MKYFIILFLLILPGIILAQNSDGSSTTDNSSKTRDFLDRPNYDDKNSIEELMNFSDSKIIIFFIIVFAVLFIPVHNSNDAHKIKIFSGIYIGTTVLFLYGFLNYFLYVKWSFYFCLEYIIFGIIIGLLSGISAFIWFKYQSQMYAQFKKSLVFIRGILS
jgi:hypothetical protein